MNWIAYCKNLECKIFKDMVVINRGFGEFKLTEELSVQCPRCQSSQTLVLRNIGFIRCSWQIKGVLNLDNGQNSQLVSFDGKCYDSCMYTMKEIDIKNSWIMLRVVAEKLDKYDEGEIQRADARKLVN